MLKGFNYPLTPKGKSTLNPRPPWYYAADFLSVEFWSDPSAVTAVLPPGLDPDSAANGHGNALFYDWQFSGTTRSISTRPGISIVNSFCLWMPFTRAGWPGPGARIEVCGVTHRRWSAARRGPRDVEGTRDGSLALEAASNRQSAALSTTSGRPAGRASDPRACRERASRPEDRAGLNRGRFVDAPELSGRRTVGLGAGPLRQRYPGFHGIRRRRSEDTQGPIEIVRACPLPAPRLFTTVRL
jgi:hypothetical protein